MQFRGIYVGGRTELDYGVNVSGPSTKPTKFPDCITPNHENKVEWQISGVPYLNMWNMGYL